MSTNQIEIDIDVVDRQWDVLGNINSLASRTIETTRRYFCPYVFDEISLVFTNDTQIKMLNKTYRHKDKPTNVLSFPTHNAGDILFAMPDIGNIVLGDIILAYETIASEAKLAQITLQEHTTHLLVHGYLHLQGLDHQEGDQAEVMEAMEIMILADLGIKNPYVNETAKG